MYWLRWETHTLEHWGGEGQGIPCGENVITLEKGTCCDVFTPLILVEQQEKNLNYVKHKKIHELKHKEIFPFVFSFNVITNKTSL